MFFMAVRGVQQAAGYYQEFGDELRVYPKKCFGLI
jgi:hypothetical protein